jgi:SAM-dependent methyltransferase
LTRLSLSVLWGFALRSNLYPSKIRLDASARALVPRLAGRVLDVGAGGQPYRQYLGESIDYLSMDLSDATGADIVGSVLDIPMGDGDFDGIICTEVIEHVEDPQSAVRELLRVTRSGGLMYLTAPMSWGLHYEPHDYFRYTKYGLFSMLEREGFRVLEMRQIGGVFVMAWARISDVMVTLLYRLGFPLKYVLGNKMRISILSLIAFPFVALGDAVATLADAVIPGSRNDALGWVILAQKDGESAEQ